jgi:tetratricopeptide (TPR) repeat protein
VLRGIADSGFEDQPAITIELLGSTLQQLGEREKARDVYRTGIDRFPSDFSLQYRLGRLLTPPELDGGVRDEMLEALEGYRAALALRPNNTVVRYYMGRLYHKLGEFERSIEQLTIALRPRPDEGAFLFHLASSRYQLGQLDPALEILRPLVDRKQPGWLEGWASLLVGRCLLARGDKKEAVASFERAVAVNPNQAQFQAGLFEAAILAGASSVEEQQRVLTRYLASFPNDPEVLNNIAWVRATAVDARARNVDEAVRLARHAIELRPNFEAWNTLGVALYYSGDDLGAIDAFHRSIRVQESAGHVVDWLFLAMAHQRLGHTSEARDWYERAVEWMRDHAGSDPEVTRFRAEADAAFGR